MLKKDLNFEVIMIEGNEYLVQNKIKYIDIFKKI